MIKVAIISPKRSLTPISKVIENYAFDCIFDKYIYNELSEINEIYERCKDTCDVMFFSGELGYHYIFNHINDVEIPCAFTAYGTIDVLSILLDFHYRHPEVNPSRVYVDFLTPVNLYMGIHDYLSPEFMPYCYDGMVYEYEFMKERAKHLWSTGKIDYMITRSINILGEYEKLGIPYEAVFPTEQMIFQSIQGAVEKISLQGGKKTEKMIILIRYTSGQEDTLQAREYAEATFYKALVDMRKELKIEFQMVHWHDRFELRINSFFTSAAIELLQNIIRYLRKNIPFSFFVGAGMFHQHDTCHFYAERALHEAYQKSKQDGFLVTGEDAQLIGPLSAKKPITRHAVTQNSQEKNTETGIKSRHWMNLLSLFQKDPACVLTSENLSEYLLVTPRTVNRLLHKLENAGFIRRIEQSRKQEKGRPSAAFIFVNNEMKKVANGQLNIDGRNEEKN